MPLCEMQQTSILLIVKPNLNWIFITKLSELFTVQWYFRMQNLSLRKNEDKPEFVLCKQKLEHKDNKYYDVKFLNKS